MTNQIAHGTEPALATRLPDKPGIAIIGGGIAGLGAAWRLTQRGARVTLLERDSEVGGRCRTFLWHGQWQIRGAAAFIAAEQNLIEQARELGIYTADQLEDATPGHSWQILHKGSEVFELRNFSAGEVLRCAKLPWRERLALARALPMFLAQATRGDVRDPTTGVNLDTISACAYFRRLSPTFVDYCLEPIMQMFCGYGEDDYSLAWLMWLSAGEYGWSKKWWHFRERGVGRLTQELGQQLVQRGVSVRTGVTVERVQPTDAGVTVTARTNGLTADESYDAAIVAVPGALAGSLVRGLTPAAQAFFNQVEYVSHHIVYAVLQWPGATPSAWRRVLPTIEGYRCLSNFSVTHLAGEDWLFYGEVKGVRCRELAQQDDAAIVNEAVADLMRTRPQLGTPRIIDSYLQRNDLALCRRHVGYTRALAAFRALAPLHRIEFAGDYLVNSTVGQAHYSGLLAAERLAARMARAANTSSSESAAASADAQPMPR